VRRGLTGIFASGIEASDVIRTFPAPTRSSARKSRRAARDGSMTLDAGRGKAPLLTMFGGDVTTSRLQRGAGCLRPHPFLSDVAALDRQDAAPGRRLSPGRGSTIRSIMRASAGGF